MTKAQISILKARNDFSLRSAVEIIVGYERLTDFELYRKSTQEIINHIVSTNQTKLEKVLNDLCKYHHVQPKTVMTAMKKIHRKVCNNNRDFSGDSVEIYLKDYTKAYGVALIAFFKISGWHTGIEVIEEMKPTC